MVDDDEVWAGWQRRLSGLQYDLAFWRGLAFKSEAAGQFAIAATYWRAALAAAQKQAPSEYADTDLKWLCGRLDRASAVAQLALNSCSRKGLH